MSMLLEHDYISLSEVPSMVTSEKVSSTVTTTTTSTDNNNSERNCATGLNLKATELRLGLPGSESPERTATDHKEIVEDKNVYPHGLLKSLVSGAKRGFSDTIDIGSGKWVFSGTGGSEVDFIKNGGLFSPRGKNGGNQVTVSEVNGQQLGLVTLAAASDGVAKFSRPVQDKKPQLVPASSNGHGSGPVSKAQVVGWPPIRSFRKNTMANNPPKNDDNLESKIGSGCLYVKVSMDGAPYLRKLDLQTCRSYVELSSALEKMFSCFTSGQCCADGVTNRDEMNESRMMDLLHGSEYVLTFEDKDGDWMLVGDVPWEMFTETCKRLRIMKSSEAIGLAPRAMEKCKNRN